jgi:hypothetical protein
MKEKSGQSKIFYQFFNHLFVVEKCDRAETQLMPLSKFPQVIVKIFTLGNWGECVWVKVVSRTYYFLG